MTVEEGHKNFVKTYIKDMAEWNDYKGLEGLIEMNSPVNQNSMVTFKQLYDEERLKEWEKYSKIINEKFTVREL